MIIHNTETSKTTNQFYTLDFTPLCDIQLDEESLMPYRCTYFGVPMGDIPFPFLIRMYKVWTSHPNRSYEPAFLSEIDYLNKNRATLSP